MGVSPCRLASYHRREEVMEKSVALAVMKLYNDEIDMIKERIKRAEFRGESKLMKHLETLKSDRYKRRWEYKNKCFVILYGGSNGEIIL